jgi:glycosyltransferase involved in cell wall biosynthesis
MCISILILTLNEEMNLPACLESVKWSDDIVVLDSYSADKTAEIAENFGSRIVKREFDNWSAHQNWAMENIPFKYEWVFYLDADERMPNVLKDEIVSIATKKTNGVKAYYCGRRNYFMGHWIKHAMPPGNIMRFFKPQHIRFERLVNPVPIINGKHGYLTNYFDHYNFSKGITEWIDKHNKYSLLEAKEGIKLKRSRAGSFQDIFSNDKSIRRKALKELSFRLPFRPIVKFIYLYFIKFGFLDAKPGFTYCILQSIYEYMIVLKMREIERNEQGLPS